MVFAKGLSDKKNYRRIVLSNGLEALLINEPIDETRLDEDEPSDDESSSEDGDSEASGGGGPQRSAAAMVVGVGSWSDPLDTPGCAHFLEHMLFMGNEKYPDESAFDSFLSKNGGSSNAHTDDEWTTFHMDVLEKGLEGALDMFAQFFAAPLMRKDCVEREVRAVQAEFTETKRSDEARFDEVMYRAAPNGHPFAHFSWGNAESLRNGDDEALSAMRAMYEKYYHARNMKLCVIGTASLDHLEMLVRNSFHAVRASPAPPIGRATWDLDPPPRWSPAPLSSPPRLVRIAPIQETKKIRIVWPVDAGKSWRSKPEEVCAHVLGHEGGESAAAALRSRGLCTEIVAGLEMNSATCGALFSVTLTLSNAAEWATAIDVFFRYARKCAADQDLPGRVFDEMSRIAQLRFDYAAEREAVDLAEELATTMLPLFGAHPRENLLRAEGGVLAERDDDAVREMLAIISNPKEACRIELVTPDFMLAASSPSNKAKVVEAASSPSLEASSCGCGKKKRSSKTCQLCWSDAVAKELTPFAAYAELATKRPDRQASIEARFGTEYWVDEIDETLLNLWGESTTPRSYDDTAPPSKNNFVPTDLTLVAPASTVELASNAATKRVSTPKAKRLSEDLQTAEKIFQKECDGEAFPRPPRKGLEAYPISSLTSSLYHCQRPERIDLPHAEIRVRLRPAYDNDVDISTRMVSLELLALATQDALADELYAATQADLHYSVSTRDVSTVVKVGGFSQPLPMLLDAVLKGLFAARDALAAQTLTMRLAAVRDKYSRSLANAWQEDVAVHARQLRLCLLCPESAISQTAALTALQNAKILPKIDYVGADVLVVGNADSAYAASVDDVVRKYTPVAEEKLSPQRTFVTRLGEAGSVCRIVQPSVDPDSETTALEVYWQVGPDTTRLRALTEFLESLLEQPIFDQLRTNEQLGYTVSAGSRWTDGVVGFGVRLVSDKASPEMLEKRLDAFLKKFRKTTLQHKSFARTTFLEHCEAVAQCKLEKPRSYEEIADNFWNSIFDQLPFDVSLADALEMASLTPRSVRDFYDHLFGFGEKGKSVPGAPKLVVAVVGKGRHEPQLQAGESTLDGALYKEDNLSTEFRARFPKRYQVPPLVPCTTTIKR